MLLAYVQDNQTQKFREDRSVAENQDSANDQKEEEEEEEEISAVPRMLNEYDSDDPTLPDLYSKVSNCSHKIISIAEGKANNKS
ncbi:hypothetical protein TKK_0002877 [Trichogramma kaykai]